ncbi:MAG: hypothetical protein ACJAYC_000652 [Halieaceae bacterium]|jgi:hypothetical protein
MCVAHFIAIAFLVATHSNVTAADTETAAAPSGQVVAVISPTLERIVEWDEYTGRVSDTFVSVGNPLAGGAAGGTLLTTVVSIDPIYLEFTASEAEYLKYRRRHTIHMR